MTRRRARRAGAARYPIGTVALYGPDDKITTKIVAAVRTRKGWTSPWAAIARSVPSGRASRGAGERNDAAQPQNAGVILSEPRAAPSNRFRISDSGFRIERH
jgi:hypothetical protein